MHRFAFLIICIFPFAIYAQVEQPLNAPTGVLPVPADTTILPQDDSVPAITDSTGFSSESSLNKSDTTRLSQKGDIETTILYSARDSIRATIDGKKIWLYGDAKITYGAIELEAEEIVIDYANNTLTAHGTRDSLGQRVGYPIFKNGEELYETKDIVYNFKTRRARITEVVTKQGDGFMHSDVAFKNEQNEVFSVGSSYTTCDLEHPHYLIRSSKAKAIPNDKIVSGPFHMEFNSIPLPIGFLFGMFPFKRESKSGIIFPSYGEEKRRGFNLRGGGYFFDINEYVKAAITGDIYSKGAHALNLSTNYLVKYRFGGSARFDYSKNPNSVDNIEDESFTRDFRVSWSHTPQTKGNARFAASVNAATSTYTANNNIIGQGGDPLYGSQLTQITSKLSSNVSYNQRFPGSPFSLGVNLTHNQDIQTRQVDLTLPNLSFNMTNIYPFQGKTKSGQGALETLSLAYSMNASNRINNNLGKIIPGSTRDSIAAFNFDNLPLFLKNAKKGVRHSIPTTFSFRALRFFTFSPSINYEELWYGEKLEWGFDPNTGDIVKVDTIQGFNRVANYSFSMSMTTRIYGMYLNKNPNSKVKAIRHIMNPTVSWGLVPNFVNNENYFQKLVDTITNEVIYRSRHEGFVYGESVRGKSNSISFGLGNNLEMKVQSPDDSVARKVMLLNNLSFSSSYNFIADSFKLSPIGMAANTTILDNLINLNLNATLDPYTVKTEVDEEGQLVEERVDEYAWRSGSLGRITNANFALSTSLNPNARKQQAASREKIAQSDLPQQDKEFLLNNPDAYIDFEIPWNLNIQYNLNYVHSLNADPRLTQSLQFNGDLSLSKSWKIIFSSGYDFQSKQVTLTTIRTARDLHCWTLSFDWTPFGRYQSYNFSIHVKSSMLQDLKIDRRKSFVDNF